ncbi:transposase [Methylobacterium sp. J-092]|uniref:transposase n=1 Tax=Methylobacterium sp. J-092 TaxID=2836667 RepID=UPI0039194616
MVQICIVHLLRHSLDTSPTSSARPWCLRSKTSSPARPRHLRSSLDGFRVRQMEPEIPSHRPELAKSLEQSDPVLIFPGEVRRILYTTNAIEALNATLRRSARPGSVPDQRSRAEAALLGLEPIRQRVQVGPA